jgi:CRISPR-associated protein Cas6
MIFAGVSGVMRMKIDLVYPIMCPHAIPADHGYLLYSAVSRALPEAHGADGYGIHPIGGRQLGGRTLQLTEHSRLAIRTDAQQIARFLPLAGKGLRLIDRTLRIGVPQVHALLPAVALRSRLVTIKLSEAASLKGNAAEEAFRAAVVRKLEEIGILSEALVTLAKRRTIRIKDKEVFGYEVLVERLSAAESLALQEHGLGGRRHMGCGLFAPIVTGGTKQ